MTLNAITRRTITGLGTGVGMTAVALALPVAAQAQVYAPMSSSEVRTLPPEYQNAPVTDEYSETIIDADGYETITRTRRIETSGPYQSGPHQDAAYPGAAPAHHGQTHGYAPAGYAPAPVVFQRNEWLDECEARTNGRGDSEKGGIIGGLLGAIAGGIVGNRVSSSERLGGTLIGAGVGGLGGLLIGSLIGGGRDNRGDYDCEAALDSYLSQYGHGAPGVYPAYGQHGAARSIPAPAYAQQGYGSYYGYSYAPPQQIVYVPIEIQQQQRVIVRETIREEGVPGTARRVIPAPAPRRSAPRYIKGN